MRKLVFSSHAVTRYQERVKPGLTRGQIRDELERLAPILRHTDLPPDWRDPAECNRNETFAYLTDGIVFVCTENGGDKVYAVTCLVRGGLSPHARRRRQDRKERRRRRAKERRSRRSPHEREMDLPA